MHNNEWLAKAEQHAHARTLLRKIYYEIEFREYKRLMIEFS